MNDSMSDNKNETKSKLIMNENLSKQIVNEW